MVRRDKVKRRVRVKSGRLNLMIDPDLKEWAHEYARRRSTSLSAVITRHLFDLKELEMGDGIEQI